jgi:hypothetical protein
MPTIKFSAMQGSTKTLDVTPEELKHHSLADGQTVTHGKVLMILRDRMRDAERVADRVLKRTLGSRLRCQPSGTKGDSGRNHGFRATKITR